MSLPTKSNVSRPEALGYDALIEYGDTAAESLYLRLFLGPNSAARLQVVEPEDRNLNTASNPEDMRSESGESYSRSNFTGGEGLDRAHRRDGTDRDYTRFWDSRNIDISPAVGGQAEEIKLLHSTSALRTGDPTNARTPLVRLGTSLYGVISDDTKVDQTANPTASSPTWNVRTIGGSGSVADLAALGDELYVAMNTIYKGSGASWASWSSLDADRIWSAKGRIIAAVGTALYEAAASGNDILLHTLASGQTWNDVVDAGAAILAAASDGYVYAFVDEDGTLALRHQALFEGEVPTALGYGQGFVFIGTAETTTGGGKIGRLWRAVLVGLRIREAQVLRTWGTGANTIDQAPRRIISTREAVWTGVIESGTETHLWRYHLESGGLVRDLILGASGQIQGIAVFDDRMFATVFADDLYREDTTYASTGYLIGPLADFYNAGQKAWVGARLQIGTRPTQGTVVLKYSTDTAAIEDSTDSSWTTVINLKDTSPVGAGDSTETAITEVQSRYLAGLLTLTPNTAQTATPTVLAFSFRAVPLPTEDVFELPVNVSDRYERPGQKPLTINGVGDAVYDQLRSLMGKAATVTLLRPDEQVIGQLLSMTTPLQDVPEYGTPTLVSLLRVKGQRQ